MGGTHILGGRGSYLGTVAGTMFIILLASALSVMQMPEASRQIIYGVVIVTMVLLHGRSGRREWSCCTGYLTIRKRES
jgi:ribose transport system permease protein